MIKWIIIGAVIAALVFYVFPMYVLSIVLYRILLVRTNKDKWGYECTLKDDAEQMEMYAEGERWADKYKENRKDVSVTSEGFKLFGRYYDFGNDKAVIIIPGRMEACVYSCFFAEPYRAKGYNVLVIDNRAHGFSEGKYDCLGFKEYKDILKWGELLNRELKNKSIVCHGICIGSATALYAMAKEDCPEYFKGLIADGMFVTFRESFKNHLLIDNRPRFPMELLVMAHISFHSGANALKEGPITRIDKMKKPILFLYGKQDKFSVPEKAKVLYGACPSEKELVWFDKGEHSHLRINAPQKYDESIGKFLEKIEG